jgi:hypothetical protein
MPDDKNDDDYEIGFGKPPRSTQFKKGQSGNRHGRPPGTKNMNTLLSQELKEHLVVTENGRRKKISKMRVAIKNLVNKGLTDRRFMTLLLDAIRLMEVRNETASAGPAPPLEEADRKIVENFLKRSKGDEPDESDT